MMDGSKVLRENGWVQSAERECWIEMMDGSKVLRVLRENVGLKL